MDKREIQDIKASLTAYREEKWNRAYLHKYVDDEEIQNIVDELEQQIAANQRMNEIIQVLHNNVPGVTEYLVKVK